MILYIYIYIYVLTHMTIYLVDIPNHCQGIICSAAVKFMPRVTKNRSFP